MPSALRTWRLRPSRAHCVRKLAKSLAKSWQGGSDFEVDAAEVVEEKEEKKKEEEKNNSDQI